MLETTASGEQTSAQLRSYHAELLAALQACHLWIVLSRSYVIQVHGAHMV